MEMEQNRQIPFLDLLIIREDDGGLKFDIFRKQTNNGNYLKYNSKHPIDHKRAVGRSLVDRANRLCSDDTLTGELNQLPKTMIKNGYPKHFIDKIIANSRNNRNNNEVTDRPCLKYISTPYIKATIVNALIEY